jgi:hypothetical protein
MEKLRDQFARETDPAKQKAIAEAVQLQATKMVSHIALGQWYNRSLMRKNLVARQKPFAGGLSGKRTCPHGYAQTLTSTSSPRKQSQIAMIEVGNVRTARASSL